MINNVLITKNLSLDILELVISSEKYLYLEFLILFVNVFRIYIR